MSIHFGEIPDGEIVTVHFRIKTSKFDWAIYSTYAKPKKGKSNK